MIITKDVIKTIRKYCKGVLRVQRHQWDDMTDDQINDETGYNLLFAGNNVADLVDSDSIEEMIDSIIPAYQGFVHIDIGHYGRRGDYRIGERTFLFKDNGQLEPYQLIWYSHKDLNDKVGTIVAKHFGMES